MGNDARSGQHFIQNFKVNYFSSNTNSWKVFTVRGGGGGVLFLKF